MVSPQKNHRKKEVVNLFSKDKDYYQKATSFERRNYKGKDVTGGGIILGRRISMSDVVRYVRKLGG